MSRPRGGETTGGSSVRVERHFGDLIDEVAIDAPLSRRRLIRGLVVVDRRGRTRDRVAERARDRLDLPAGVVYVLPVDEWSAVTEGLLPVTELAVRETHRRLTRVLADDLLPPGTDPLVVLSTS